MAKSKSAGTQNNDAATQIYVAYNDGPPEIGFAGRRWMKGLPQSVTAQEWEGIQAHPHSKQFDFKVEE